jgi:hypothetical protein
MLIFNTALNRIMKKYDSNDESIGGKMNNKTRKRNCMKKILRKK